MQITVEKYHGLGNDYLIWDPARNQTSFHPRRIQLICNRNFGIGSDGILYGPIYENGAPRVQVYNPDGQEAEQLGNGLHIFAKYLKDAGYIKENQLELQTKSGTFAVEYLGGPDDLLRAHMGKPTFYSDEIPVTGTRREVILEPMQFGEQTLAVTCLAVGGRAAGNHFTGNPHCVILTDTISKEEVCQMGAKIEQAEQFPNHVNVQFMQILDPNTIQVQIYERGAGYTLSSGSCGVAAACASHRLGKTGRNVTVVMPGGKLTVEIAQDGSVQMTGPVKNVASVVLSKQFLEDLKRLG